MKRKARGGKGGGGGGGGIHPNKKRGKMKEPPPPPPPVIGTVATRTRHQQKTKASSWNKPIPILINIFTYADPETLRILCLISKQFLDIISNAAAMENHRVVPLLQISPSEMEQDDKGRTARLIPKLHRHRTKLQHYREIKFIDGHKFSRGGFSSYYRYLCEELFEEGLNGVVSLDLSSSTPAPPNGFTNNYLLYFMSKILPNLRQIDFSNSNTGLSGLRQLIQICSRLEKITWNKIPSSSRVDIDGVDFEKATNLKEIYMDNAEFFDDVNPNGRNNTIFLFHKCGSNKLERVSIRNATYGNDVFGLPYGHPGHREQIYLPQDALIKFVRKAPPSLRWFRSNLTTDNIAMLRLERPEIECVN